MPTALPFAHFLVLTNLASVEEGSHHLPPGAPTVGRERGNPSDEFQPESGNRGCVSLVEDVHSPPHHLGQVGAYVATSKALRVHKPQVVSPSPQVRQ